MLFQERLAHPARACQRVASASLQTPRAALGLAGRAPAGPLSPCRWAGCSQRPCRPPVWWRVAHDASGTLSVCQAWRAAFWPFPPSTLPSPLVTPVVSAQLVMEAVLHAAARGLIPKCGGPAKPQLGLLPRALVSGQGDLPSSPRGISARCLLRASAPSGCACPVNSSCSLAVHAADGHPCPWRPARFSGLPPGALKQPLRPFLEALGRPEGAGRRDWSV